jgi:hypothetical protein
MNRIGRLALGIAIAAVLHIVGSVPAAADDSINVKRADQGSVGAARSQGFTTFAEEMKRLFPGLCDAGVAILADAARVTSDTPILSHASMARGTGGAGTPAIVYVDLDVIHAMYFAALMACPPPA